MKPSKDAREAAAFQREKRYIVIKLKDLSEAQGARLVLAMSGFTGSSRYVEEIPTRECVVVESDWPEYETVWAMIEARCTGEAHLRSTSPAGEVGEMIEDMRDGLAAIVRSLRATDQLKANGFASDAADIALGLLHDTLPRLAASDTEAMRLLREARSELEWWIEEHGCCDGHQGDLIARIDAALAKGGAPGDTEAMRLRLATIQQCCEDAAYMVTTETKADDPFVKLLNEIHALAKGGAA